MVFQSIALLHFDIFCHKPESNIQCLVLDHWLGQPPSQVAQLFLVTANKGGLRSVNAI